MKKERLLKEMALEDARIMELGISVKEIQGEIQERTQALSKNLEILINMTKEDLKEKGELIECECGNLVPKNEMCLGCGTQMKIADLDIHESGYV